MNIKFYRSVVARLAALVLLLAAGAAQATTYTFNGSDVAGCTRSGSSYTCAALPLANYNDSMVIASGATVKITSSVAFGFNQSLTMSGTAALTATGDLGIGDMNPSNLSISGGTLTASGGTFSMGAQAQTITANISATTINLGTGSTTKVTGSLTASGSIALGSHSTVVGPITAATVTSTSPVSITGNVTASNSFQLASGSTLTGNLVAPTVTLDPSPTNVVGNVTATTSLTLGSSDSITGNVVAGNVVLQDASASIGGNASVIAITLGWHGTVSGKITCTAPAGNGCSCVTNNSGYPTGTSPGPVCTSRTTTSPPPAATLDHIVITHAASALTCQATPVTVSACANASCSSAYTGGVSGTLGLANNNNTGFTIAAGSSATSASAPPLLRYAAATGSGGIAVTSSVASSCASSDGTNSCQIVFSDSGLLLSVPDHISGTPTSVSLSALKSGGNNNTGCVPLVANATKNINFTCGYANPTSGTLSIVLASSAQTGGTQQCTSALPVPVAFDSNGSAINLTMTYLDVGAMTMAVSYVSQSGTDAGQAASGSLNRPVVIAPSGFGFSNIHGVSPATTNPAAATYADSAFIGAGQPFMATIAALNTQNKSTPNFGKETPTPASVTIGSKLILPAGGSNPAPAVSLPSPAFSSGQSTGTFSWGEVGIMQLNAALVVGSVDYTSANPGLVSIPSNSPNIGRFIPDHFQTTVTANQPMDCTKVTLSCAGLTGFVYANQTFPMTVTALNAGGATTQNYGYNASSNTGFAKAVTLTAWNSSGGGQANPPTDNTAGAAAALVINSPIAATAFAGGAASVTPAYRFPAKSGVQLPEQPTAVYFRAIDSDSASSLRIPATSSLEGGVLVVNGRILLPNNYGSELLPVTVNLKSQFWNGSAWIANGADNVSQFLVSDITRIACQKSLAQNGASGPCNAAPALSVKTSPMVFSGGAAQFQLAPPGAGKTGSIDLQMPSPLAGSSGSTPAPTSNTYPASTTGREVFGVYKSGPVIYQREMY